MGVSNRAYGQLYKLNTKIQRTKVNKIWIDERYAVVNSQNVSMILNNGKPVEFNNYHSIVYILNLYTDTLMAFSEGGSSELAIRDILNALKNKDISFNYYSENERNNVPRLLSNVATSLLTMKPTNGRKKVLKGSLIFNPTLGDHNFYLYLGSNMWVFADIDYDTQRFGENPIKYYIDEIIYRLGTFSSNMIIVNIPLEKVLKNGVYVCSIDLKKCHLEDYHDTKW